MNIIIGLSNPTSGSLTIDGCKIDETNVNSYRDNISYIPQKIFLTEATVKDNVLLFSKDEFNKESYECAFEESGLKEILMNTGQDDNLKISDQTQNLSGGEKQCIGFARALYERKNIIALDEATSSMDFNLALKVTKSILEKWETVVCVTHQPFLLENFKKIIVMRDGIIEDSGSYKDLTRRNDYFRNLCSKQ